MQFQRVTKRIQAVHNFRALAILLVVASHCFTPLAIEPNTPLQKAAVSLIVGWTTPFIFLSGFLFHRVFYPRFRYLPFMEGKILNVAAPYFFLSLIVLFFTGESVELLASGRHLTAYWYIPFIMVTFALSPLHKRFIESRHLPAILAVSFVVSLLMHRPPNNEGLLQVVVWGQFPYLLGIACSIHWDRVRALDIRPLLIALGVVLVIQVATGYGNHAKPPFEFRGLDWMLIQKSLLAIIALLALERIGGQSALVDRVAEVSFGIFFLHPLLLEIMGQVGGGWPTYIPFVIAVFLTCFGGAWLAQRLPRSRQMFGC